MASIRKRGENSYQIIVSKGYDSFGNKLTSTKTITLDPELTPKQAEKEIQAQAALFEREVKNGTYLNGSKMTFAEFAERWITKYAEPELEPKTTARYKEMLYSRIIPAIGHIKLEKLQPTHLIDFYENLKETGIRLDTKYVATPELRKTIDQLGLSIGKLKDLSGLSDKTISNALNGLPITKKSANTLSKALNVKLSHIFKEHGEPGQLSPRTVLHHHRLISSILQDAVEWQVVISNVAERVKPPKVEKTPVQHYDEEQTKALLSALDSEEFKYRVMVLIDVFAGLRIGELMGLTWDNIDFENNTIDIVKASQYLTGKGTFEKQPKNETSVRRISMPAPIMSILKEYRVWWLEQKLKCGDLWKNSDRLFVTWDGQPMFTYTLTNWFPEFLKRHNLPKITPHGLRHTMASLLDSQGMETSKISKRLGHARISTTLDIYTHVFKKADTAAADLLENTLLKPKQQADKKQG